MKKNRSIQRLLCAALALCLGMAVASPIALAVTQEQEAVLATDQRSMNNPGGAFTLPEIPEDRRLFHPDTLTAGQLIFTNIAQQILLGSGEAESFRRVFAYAPIVREGDALPPSVPDWPEGDAPFVPYMRTIWQTGMRGIYVALEETAEPDIYRVVLFYLTREGEVFLHDVGTLYNAATGDLAGENGRGIMNTGYNYDAVQQMTYTAVNGWNRQFGFNALYDAATPLILFYLDTLRFPFEYQGRDVMFQFWKGFYTISNGGEIGIYEKPSDRPFHWDASDIMLDISLQIYRGDALYFDTGVRHSWWIGAFCYALPVCRQLPPKQLRMTGTITFEDPEMRDAFWASFQANKDDYIAGTLDGMVFSFDWKTSA